MSIVNRPLWNEWNEALSLNILSVTLQNEMINQKADLINKYYGFPFVAYIESVLMKRIVKIMYDRFF